MTILTSSRLARAGFAHAFPARDVPDAALLAALGVARVIQTRKQVHGARAVHAAEAEGQEADAIVGAGSSVAVGVRVADCVPVLAADEATGRVVAIHAGWRGVAAGVVREGIGLLAGGRARVLAAVGPCIGACCFEVGLEVAERVGFVVRREGDKAYVDLRAAVRSQLEAAGVGGRDIEDVPGCTRHEAELFHSFRRDGAHSGRMLAAIVARG